MTYTLEQLSSDIMYLFQGFTLCFIPSIGA